MPIWVKKTSPLPRCASLRHDWSNMSRQAMICEEIFVTL